MVLRPGGSHYEPISWDDAFALVGEQLRGLASPDEAVFYTSGKTSNEAAFVYQLFARALGTNNLPDCSNMCHESTSVALAEVIGIGKGSVTLDDIHTAELIVIAGQNPGTNHPRMLSALEIAKKNGAQDRLDQPAARGGAGAGSRTRRRRAAWSAAAPRWPTCTCRSGSTATSRCSRRSARCCSSGTPSTTHFVEQFTSGFEEYAAHVKDARLGPGGRARPG